MFKDEEEILEVVENFVAEKLNKEVWYPFSFDQDVVNHIKNICFSILCTKHEIGPGGGSFVQAVVDNDLVGAFSKADHINQRYMKIYAELIYRY
jgi:hypothetical protein